MPRCQSRLMINVLLTLEEPLLPQAWCRHLLVLGLEVEEATRLRNGILSICWAQQSTWINCLPSVPTAGDRDMGPGRVKVWGSFPHKDKAGKRGVMKIHSP